MLISRTIHDGFVLVVGRASRSYSNVEALRTIRCQHGHIRGTEKCVLSGALDEACGQRAANGSKVQQFLLQLMFSMTYCKFSVERYCCTTLSIL